MSSEREAEIRMLLEAGYEPRPELGAEGYWLRGLRIGKLAVAVAHCHARQAEIAKACAFLTAEGYSVRMPESALKPTELREQAGSTH